jgi:hypothetical protein
MKMELRVLKELRERILELRIVKDLDENKS